MQGMLRGLGSDVIKPSCSVCFCKVKTNTSMSIWTQLWYFYLPHRLQVAIIISSLVKLTQHLASSCLFASEQMEGHLVQVKQTGSSWERCLHYHLHTKAQSCLSPPDQLSLHHDPGPDIEHLCEYDSHNQLRAAESGLPHYCALAIVCNTRRLILQV